MKTMIKYRQITVQLFLFVSVLNLTLISSCTTSRDVYNPNPKQQHTSSQVTRPSTQAIRNDPPEWIFAISNEFIVGTGSGADVPEARENAINDVKSSITKLLGQTVSVYEFKATGNRISGRDQVDSESVFLITQRFKNEFDPVIVFRHDNVLDYHFEGYGNNHTYYIKYKISDAELESVKRNYKARAEKFRDLVNSLTQVESISNVEELFSRYEELHILLHAVSNLSKTDSIRIDNAFNRLLATVDDLHINILESNNHKVAFQIVSLGKSFSTSSEPVISAPESIKIKRAHRTGNQWSFTYEPLTASSKPESISIRFDYPEFRLQHRITSDKPAEIITEEIMISSMIINIKGINNWTGNITQMEITMNIESESEAAVNTIDVALVSNTGHSHTIFYRHVDISLSSGNNIYKEQINSNISSRFIRSAASARVGINYAGADRKSENKTFEIPVIINF